MFQFSLLYNQIYYILKSIKTTIFLLIENDNGRRNNASSRGNQN